MDAKLTDQDLSLWCFGRVLPLLDGLHDSGTQRDRAGNRKFFFDDHCKLILLFLFNPAIGSLRLLQEASALPKVAKMLGIKRPSLGSFSESSRLFEPQLLQHVIAELGAQAVKLPITPELAPMKHLLTIVDGTLLTTLPKLAQTLCHTSRNGEPHHAWRLHVHLTLDSPVPERIIRTSGSNRTECSERQQLRRNLLPDRCYVLDRGFHDASLLNGIDQAANLLEEPAELIALIYRYRWTIELFFRMLKQLLGCRHLLSHRPNGVDIQFYCAVIACLLIYLQTGKKPNKYLLFMTGMYLAGVASLEELLAFVNRPDNTGVKKRAKDELWKKLGVL